MNLTKKFTSPVKFWIAHKAYLIVYDPEHMKAVLNSPKTMEKDDVYKFIEPWGGTGLPQAPGICYIVDLISYDC